MKFPNIKHFALSFILFAGYSLFMLKTHAAEPSANQAKAAFERLKKLSGEWIDTTENEHKKAGKSVTYKVVANGSAVFETLFPGLEHEMVTVYYLDGDQLVLTHYCAAKNQPRMKAVNITEDRIDFDFIGGSNINPAKDMHMHSSHLRWAGADTLVGEWIGWADGKPSDHSVKFQLKRVEAKAGK